MQIEEIEAKTKEQVTYEDTIVSVDYALSKLRHYNNTSVRDRDNGNPWPEVSYLFRERSVNSNQLWLHNIEYKTLEETTSEIKKYQSQNKEYQLEETLVFYYDFDIQLNILCNCEINWTNTSPLFAFKTVQVIGYIKYLKPLLTITGKDIITTIIAREQTTTQHIFRYRNCFSG